MRTRTTKRRHGPRTTVEEETRIPRVASRILFLSPPSPKGQIAGLPTAIFSLRRGGKFFFLPSSLSRILAIQTEEEEAAGTRSKCEVRTCGTGNSSSFALSLLCRHRPRAGRPGPVSPLSHPPSPSLPFVSHSPPFSPISCRRRRRRRRHCTAASTAARSSTCSS